MVIEHISSDFMMMGQDQKSSYALSFLNSLAPDFLSKIQRPNATENIANEKPKLKNVKLEAIHYDGSMMVMHHI